MIFKLLQTVYRAIVLLALCLSGAIYANLFVQIDWRLDLATNLLPQILICTAALTAFCICVKDRIIANANLALTLLLFAFIFLTISDNNSISGDKPDISFLAHNLNLENTNYKETEDLILEIDPDVMLLSEFQPDWNAKLARLAVKYPFKFTIPNDKGHGISLYSKYMIMENRIEHFASVDFPCIVSKIQFKDHRIKVIGVHLNPPINAYEYTQLGLQVEALKEEINKSEGEPVILLGDCNFSPYSPFYRSIISETTLQGTAFTTTLKNT
jgi:endonuclease/exonuclease/phosphatase (EEP) superfamily protein YafD